MSTIKELRDKAQQEVFVTVQQFAVLVQYHPRSIYRLIERNKLPGVKRIAGSRSVRIEKAVALAGLPPKSVDPFDTPL